MIFLLLLFVQSAFHPFKTVGLSGYVYDAALDTFNIHTIEKRKWQRSAERVVTRNFGFREAMIRIYNQGLFTFFDETGPFVFMGKDGFLFEKTYIPAICGENFIGDQKMLDVCDSLRFLKESLQANAKELLVIIAPNKLRFHREQAGFECDASDKTNYAAFKQCLSNGDIHSLDFIDMFDTLKSEHPLFSKSGTHWSLWGASLGAFKLQEWLVSSGLASGTLETKQLDVSTRPRKTDGDLHGLLNIMTPANDLELAYPTLRYVGSERASALIIGDSYFNMFHHLNLPSEMFDEHSTFLYYNKSIFVDGPNKRRLVSAAERNKALMRADVVIIETNEDAIATFGWGFLTGAISVLNE